MRGWFRLWIVTSLAVWAAGVVHFFLLSDYRPAPPFVMSRWEICDGYYVSGLETLFDNPRRLRISPAAVEFVDPPPTPEACLTDDDMFTAARAWHWRDFFHWWGRMWPYWLAPFGIGLLMVSGLWVWRGFRRQS